MQALYLKTFKMPDTHEKLQIVLVEDHMVFREALATIIEANPQFTVAGQAADVDAALQLIRTTKPDLAIIDIALNGGSGFSLVKQMKSEFPALKVLMFSGSEEAQDEERAVSVGASGYLTKGASPELLMTVLARLAEGKMHFSESLRHTVISRMVAGKPVISNPSAVLSARELEIFRLFGEGKGVADIADALQLSRKTVDAYRGRIKTKLSLPNAITFLKAAIQWRQGEHEPLPQ